MSKVKKYVRLRWAAFKVTEEELETILNKVSQAREANVITYILLKILEYMRTLIAIVLFPLWLISYLIDNLLHKFLNFYENKLIK